MKLQTTLLICVTAVLVACKPASDAVEPVTAPAVQPHAVTSPVAATNLPPVVREEDASPGVEAPWIHQQCGDLLVSVRTQRDEMELTFSGRDITLPQVPATSGARYDDGNGNAFWSTGDETMLTINGKAHGACTRSERASPWVDAHSRGIGFRAVGSEPGWYVEVGRGGAPALHALLDYGERTIDVTHAEPVTGDMPGFRGTATDGTAIELRIARTPCNDGMSGEAFEASAELLVADKSYKGCGAYL